MNLLIVDDDKGIIDFLKPALKAEGFVVDATEDGNTGSYKAKINEYDLIILDVELPHKDGREICSEIRSAGKSLPIIMLSVKGEINTKVELFDIGADDYVTKPFFAELLVRIKALLRRPQKIEDDVLCVQDVILDRRKHTVSRSGKEIRLTPKEFFLLEYLMHNRGRALPRMEILEHVWDMNANPFTNTLETHIANLRSKLDAKHKRNLIHTVSGTGYKIYGTIIK